MRETPRKIVMWGSKKYSHSFFSSCLSMPHKEHRTDSVTVSTFFLVAGIPPTGAAAGTADIEETPADFVGGVDALLGESKDVRDRGSDREDRAAGTKGRGPADWNRIYQHQTPVWKP